MSLNRDRNFFPTNLGARPTAKGYARYFTRFVAPLKFGESWSRLSSLPAGWEVERLRHLLGECPESLVKTLMFLGKIESQVGRRFQISSRMLATAIDMSQSTASRCLRKLRELGILKLYREHQIKRVGKRWIGKAAIHEVLMTHPPGGSDLVEVSQPPSPGQTPEDPGLVHTARSAVASGGAPTE